MIAIIDYKMGNLPSVKNAFDYLGYDARITDDLKEIEAADRLVLPGVGSYRKAMENIHKMNLFDMIHFKVKSGCPILGICLGMQLMAEDSNEDMIEGVTRGFGFLPFQVRRFEESVGLPVPHIGFNEVNITEAGKRMFRGIETGSDFYFVHSYRIISKDRSYCAGETEYGNHFISAYVKGNIWGVQFHPEKSQSNGLKLLSNFVGEKTC